MCCEWANDVSKFIAELTNQHWLQNAVMRCYDVLCVCVPTYWTAQHDSWMLPPLDDWTHQQSHFLANNSMQRFVRHGVNFTGVLNRPKEASFNYQLIMSNNFHDSTARSWHSSNTNTNTTMRTCTQSLLTLGHWGPYSAPPWCAPHPSHRWRRRSNQSGQAAPVSPGSHQWATLRREPHYPAERRRKWREQRKRNNIA